MEGHHLILGELTDYLTGGIVADTHDERYRQKIARYLVDVCGYRKTDISPHHELVIRAGDLGARVWIDFLVSVDTKIGLLVKYGPGSLTTRHRPSLAASRLVAPYQVPLVAVTNGESCELLDGASGKVIGQGFSALPLRAQLANRIAHANWMAVSAAQAKMEARIMFAYEVDGACPCDDTVCRI